MPKRKTLVGDVFKQFGPEIQDPKNLVADNSNLYVEADEDELSFPIGNRSIEDFVDASNMRVMAPDEELWTGVNTGGGQTPAEELNRLVSENGQPRLAKIDFFRQGSFSIAPFGFVFSQVAAAWALATFTTAFDGISLSLQGDSVKLGAFINFEAIVNRRISLSLNREPDFNAAVQGTDC